MNSIGFRVSPNCVNYCIVNTNDERYEILDVNKIKIPQNINKSAQLSFLRTHIISIMKEYEIKKAGIRTTENNARTISIPRLHMEGVIMETFSDIDNIIYFTGTIGTIASLLKEESKIMKKYIDNSMNFMGIEKWGEYSKDDRESIITSIASSNLDGSLE